MRVSESQRVVFLVLNIHQASRILVLQWTTMMTCFMAMLWKRERERESQAKHKLSFEVFWFLVYMFLGKFVLKEKHIDQLQVILVPYSLGLRHKKNLSRSLNSPIGWVKYVPFGLGQIMYILSTKFLPSLVVWNPRAFFSPPTMKSVLILFINFTHVCGALLSVLILQQFDLIYLYDKGHN